MTMVKQFKSIKELDDYFRKTDRPIKVKKGRLAGRLKKELRGF